MSESDYLQGQDDLYYEYEIKPIIDEACEMTDIELAGAILGDIKRYKRFRINVKEVCECIIRRKRATNGQREVLRKMYVSVNR